jgi:hypothetical protein
MVPCHTELYTTVIYTGKATLINEHTNTGIKIIHVWHVIHIASKSDIHGRLLNKLRTLRYNEGGETRYITYRKHGLFCSILCSCTTLRHHNIHTTEKQLAEDMLKTKHKAQNIDPLEKFTELNGRYLEERKWRVHLKFPKYSNSSNWCIFKHGVRQGSVLVPWLFSLQINDFPVLINEIKSVKMFADDTS